MPTNKHTYISIYKHKYTHTHIHTHIQTYKHTYIQTYETQHSGPGHALRDLVYISTY